MSRISNLEGRTFGRLKVLQFSHTYNNHAYWVVRCDCGTVKQIQSHYMKNGTQSCGCLQKQTFNNFRHGHAKVRSVSPEYKALMSALGRCHNPNDVAYCNYGARGISVCERWRGENGFINFLKDMGERPEGKTLDRYPDTNGNYTPENCRWATPEEQNNNKRSNRFLEANGEKLTVMQWVKKLGITRGKLRHWLDTHDEREFSQFVQYLTQEKDYD